MTEKELAKAQKKVDKINDLLINDDVLSLFLSQFGGVTKLKQMSGYNNIFTRKLMCDSSSITDYLIKFDLYSEVFNDIHYRSTYTNEIDAVLLEREARFNFHESRATKDRLCYLLDISEHSTFAEICQAINKYL